MTKTPLSIRALATVAFALSAASCNAKPNESASAEASAKAQAENARPFTMSEVATFTRPWAIAVEPGSGTLFITEKGGTIRSFNPKTGEEGEVSGVPKVDYGGQGGLGDMVFAPDYATSKMVYLSWAEAGSGDTRGAAVGRAKLTCEALDCDLSALEVIWRQTPKVTGRGHYSHRLAFSPDGKYLFIASGDRQKLDPAQDMNTNLGKIVRLLPDGTPAPGNPFADQGSPANQIWSLGHRNILGLTFDLSGQLWDLEHGPRGGDELNLVRKGTNYGWPLVSEGKHYSGEDIPNHATRPEFAAPAISWTPVIAPGGMISYSGDAFANWRGDLLIASLHSGLVRITLDGDKASEAARYDFGTRLRDIAEGPEGEIWIVEDGKSGRLMRLSPAAAQ